MGCGSSSPVLDPAAEARNRQIDRALENEKQAQKLTLKVLLLGNGESGKSTVLSTFLTLESRELDIADFGGGFCCRTNDHHSQRGFPS